MRPVTLSRPLGLGPAARGRHSGFVLSKARSTSRTSRKAASAKCNACTSSTSSAFAAPSRIPTAPSRRSATLAGATAAAASPAALGADPITLPLNFYTLLHVNRASSREAVKRAYEKIIASPPDVGYSQDTLFSRAVLLKSAAECLSDLELRRAYDAAASAAGGAPTVDVTPDNLPGALVLLQEAGDSPLVLDLGRQWLRSNSRTAGQSADVAAAVALALCDLAAEDLEAGRGAAVTAACERLEEALGLLRRHGLAPQLQQQIGDTLEDFAPRYCLELLALPLNPDAPTAARRARGLALARQLLWSGPDGPALQGARGEFVDCVRTHTTAEEQMELYASPPAGVHVTLQEQMDSALAAVAAGLARRSPQLLAKADRLYAAVEAAVERERAPVDVSVERAAIALMLGDTAGALGLLGLGGGAAEGRRPNPEVIAFVQEHSPDASDPLPGVYMLTKGWLSEAVLPSFRDTTGQEEPDLKAWFASPWVQAFAQARLAARTLSPAGAARAVGAALAALAAFVAALIGRLLRALGVGGGSGEEGRGQEQERVAVQMQPAAAVAAGPLPVRAPAPEPLPPRRQEPRSAAPPPRPAPVAAAAAASGGVAATAAAAGSAAAGAAAPASDPAAQFEAEAEDAVIEFDRSKLEKEVVTIAELKRRLGAVLSDGEGVGAADSWRAAGAGGGAATGAKGQAGAQAATAADGPEEEDEEDDTDARLFQGEAYQAKREYLKRLEVQMWDSEPSPPGGPLASLRRWALPLLGLSAAAAFAAGARGGAPWWGAGVQEAAVVAQGKAQGKVRAETAATNKPAAPPVAVAAAAVAAAAPQQQQQQQSAPEASVAARGGSGRAAVVAYSTAAVAPGAPLTAEAAARAVSRLHAARAAAMGPAHADGELRGVMKGRLLRQWRSQAKRARDAGSHYVYQVRSAKIERVGPWLPSGWLARAASRGAEVVVAESDSVAVRSDAAAAGRSGGRGDSVERSLRRTLRLQQSRWVPGAEWRVVDISDTL